MEKSKTSAKGGGKLRPGHEQPTSKLQREEGENIQQPKGEQLKQKQQGQQGQQGKQGKKTSR